MNENKFVNQHLSYSRLNRFEQCPLSFKLHYIEKQTAAPSVPLRFGKMIHAVLERLYREVIHQELTGKLSEKRALELYELTWMTSGLVGADIYGEGYEIIRSFVSAQGLVNHRDILAVEQEFKLQVGRFEILGFIDRVDCIDDETIEIIDYKSNRMLFSRDELDSNLQLSLYQMAAHEIWPWAKNVRLTFHMLRHGIRMTTERTPEDLERAHSYAETLGQMTESETEFPAKLNPNCIYCDHRHQCPAYEQALQGKQDFICEDLSDLTAVAREREHVAKLAKVLYARKGELEKILKTHLKEKDELRLAGVRYAMFKNVKKQHPLDSTLTTLRKVSGLSREEILEQVASIDNKALAKFVKQLGKKIEKPQITLLKAELEATAEKSFSPRFWAKEIQQ